MPKEPKLGSEGSLGDNAKKELQNIAGRVISLLEERERVNEDISEVFNEAKDSGFDTKILRKAIKLIRTDRATRQAEEDMIETYVHAIQPDLFDKAA